MNTNVLTYEGHVLIKFLINGKEVRYKGHNEGLNAMFKYLCKALSGATNLASDKPAFFDLRCLYSDPTQGVIELPCLYNTLSLSAPEYYFDTDLNTWATRFSIVLSYNMLNFERIGEHINDQFYLYLLSQSGNDFARFKLDPSKFKLTDIIPGTQGLIEWVMIIKNVAE